MGPSAMDDKQIHWRMRRGMRELDVLMQRYFQQHYQGASAADKACFVDLLAQEDPDIWRWVMGYAEPPDEFAALIATLRESVA